MSVRQPGSVQWPGWAAGGGALVEALDHIGVAVSRNLRKSFGKLLEKRAFYANCATLLDSARATRYTSSSLNQPCTALCLLGRRRLTLYANRYWGRVVFVNLRSNKTIESKLSFTSKHPARHPNLACVALCLSPAPRSTASNRVVRHRRSPLLQLFWETVSQNEGGG